MFIYNYSDITKEFTTTIVAKENPMEPGKYLIPANATTKEPLPEKVDTRIVFDESINDWKYELITTYYKYDKDTKEYTGIEKSYSEVSDSTTIEPLPTKTDYAICFNEVNNSWEYIVDNRGKTYYLNHIKVEFELGDEITPEMTTVQYTDEELLALAKDNKITEIDNACQSAIISGFISNALGSDHFYYSTLEEQANLTSLIALGVTNDFKAQIVNADGTLGERVKHSHTLSELVQVLVHGSTHINDTIDKKDNLKTQINNAQSVTELEAIKW